MGPPGEVSEESKEVTLSHLRSKRSVLLLALLLAVMALALGAVACGEEDEGGNGGDEGTPKPGGTYNFALGAEPISIEPLNTQESEGANVTHQCFEGLYILQEQEDGTVLAVPHLAEKTEMSDDAKLFTFTIKKGVTFAPPVSREVKAQDFVDSWNWNADAKNQSDVTYIMDPIKGIDPNTGYAGKQGLTGVKALDDYTLQVELRYAYPDFPQTLAHPVTAVAPADYIKKIGARKFFDKPVGTGPYMVEEWKHNREITLVKNPEYWDEENAGYVDKIYMPIFDSQETEWLEFQKGTTDYTSVPSGQIRKAQNSPQVQNGEWHAEAYNSTAVYYICFSMDKPLLGGADKLPIREALNRSADREFVCNNVNEGVSLPSDSIVPLTMPGFKAGLNPYPYDTAKAKEVIDAYTAENGPVPTLPFWYNTGAGHEKVAEALAAGWDEAIGVKVKLNGLETNAYWTSLGEGKAPGMFRMGWIADYPSIDNFIYLFTTDGGRYGSYTFYSNPKVDELYEKARGTVDQQQRYNLYNECERLIMTDAPCVPLYTYRDFRVTNNRIGGFSWNAYGFVDMWKVWVK